MGEAPYLREERVVATSPPSEAPEYRMRAVVKREFHADSPSVRLVIEGPLAVEAEYWDSHHVQLVVALLLQALPELEQAEASVEAEWQVWRRRTGHVQEDGER